MEAVWADTLRRAQGVARIVARSCANRHLREAFDFGGGGNLTSHQVRGLRSRDADANHGKTRCAEKAVIQKACKTQYLRLVSSCASRGEFFFQLRELRGGNVGI